MLSPYYQYKPKGLCFWYTGSHYLQTASFGYKQLCGSQGKSGKIRLKISGNFVRACQWEPCYRNTDKHLKLVMTLCCTRQSRAPIIDRCTPEILPWPWPLTLTSNFDLDPTFDFDPDLWSWVMSNDRYISDISKYLIPVLGYNWFCLSDRLRPQPIPIMSRYRFYLYPRNIGRGRYRSITTQADSNSRS